MSNRTIINLGQFSLQDGLYIFGIGAITSYIVKSFTGEDYRVEHDSVLCKTNFRRRVVSSLFFMGCGRLLLKYNKTGGTGLISGALGTLIIDSLLNPFDSHEDTIMMTIGGLFGLIYASNTYTIKI